MRPHGCSIGLGAGGGQGGGARRPQTQSKVKFRANPRLRDIENFPLFLKLEKKSELYEIFEDELDHFEEMGK